MNWQKLIDVKSECIKVGTIFRFPVCGFFSGEEILEIILCASPSQPEILEFYVTSGYESGQRLTFIPRNDDCSSTQVSVSWLIENWYTHIFADSNLNDVYIYRKRKIKSLFSFKKRNKIWLSIV